jgi:hypothetical protein
MAFLPGQKSSIARFHAAVSPIPAFQGYSSRSAGHDGDRARRSPVLPLQTVDKRRERGKGRPDERVLFYTSGVLRRVGHLHAHYAPSTAHSSAREITLAPLQTHALFFFEGNEVPARYSTHWLLARLEWSVKSPVTCLVRVSQVRSSALASSGPQPVATI